MAEVDELPTELALLALPEDTVDERLEAALELAEADESLTADEDAEDSDDGVDTEEDNEETAWEDELPLELLTLDGKEVIGGELFPPPPPPQAAKVNKQAKPINLAK